MDEMDAREGRDDQSIGAISPRFASYICYRCSALASSQQDRIPTESDTELDSHADSPIVGLNGRIIKTNSKTVLASRFKSELVKPLCVPVVNAVVAYD